MNTGVQRVVRGLWAGLRRQIEVTPLIWIPKLDSYCRLDEEEQRFLESPFARHEKACATPEELSSPFPWSHALRFFRHKKNCICLATEATPHDTLLVPEIFQDNRIARFRSRHDWLPGRTHAIFHDAIALQLPEFTAPERKRHFADYVQALASFDKVICVSREVESDLHHLWKRHGTNPTPTAVLGWPTDFGLPRPSATPNHEARQILCVATLERRKNHLGLLEAMESIWSTGLHAELILIGRATADWGSTVLGQIRRLVKQGRPLRWLRHVSDDSLHQAYRSCSFTVFPSFSEGFGLPIAESLWHGRPCICSSKGAIGELARAGGCLQLDCVDPMPLANAIRLLLTNDIAYRRLCEEAIARTFSTWDHYIDRLLHEIDLAA